MTREGDTAAFDPPGFTGPPPGFTGPPPGSPATPGTPGTPAAPAAPHPAHAHRRWNGNDLVLGTGLVVLLIALFLPWFSATAGTGTAATSATTSGVAAHGYLWWAFVLTILALAAFVARDGVARIRGNLPSAGQILVGSTALSLVLAILAFTFKPAVPAAVSVTWSYGAYVAIVAAAVSFLAAAGASLPVREAAQAARAGWQRAEATGQDA